MGCGVFFSHVYITEVIIMIVASAVILLLIAIGQFYFVFAEYVENTMPVLSLVRLINSRRTLVTLVVSKAGFSFIFL